MGVGRHRCGSDNDSDEGRNSRPPVEGDGQAKRTEQSVYEEQWTIMRMVCPASPNALSIERRFPHTA